MSKGCICVRRGVPRRKQYLYRVSEGCIPAPSTHFLPPLVSVAADPCLCDSQVTKAGEAAEEARREVAKLEAEAKGLDKQKVRRAARLQSTLVPPFRSDKGSSSHQLRG